MQPCSTALAELAFQCCHFGSYSSCRSSFRCRLNRSGYPPPVDKVSGMHPCRAQLHQPVLAVPRSAGRSAIQGRRDDAAPKADTYPLVDTDHMRNDERDEGQQPSAEECEVAGLELRRTTYPCLPGIFRDAQPVRSLAHTLFIKCLLGKNERRMVALTIRKIHAPNHGRRSCSCRGRPMSQ